ncbi:glycosyltransferase family 39 protein [archaeon]|nr:glycosyltransferase family 39 protein [archaeon]
MNVLKKIKRKHLLFLAIAFLFLSGFLLRAPPLNENESWQHNHFWDEYVYLLNAELLWTGQDVYNEFSYRPPLISFLIAPFWDDPFMALMVVSFISSLAIPFIYLLGRELYDDVTGLIAAFILAFSHYLITLSDFILTGFPAVTLLIISLYFLVKNNEKMAFLAGFFGALAVLMRFNSLIILPTFLIFFYFKKIDKKILINVLKGFFATLFPYFVWAQLTLGFFALPFISATNAVNHTPLLNPFYYILAAFTVCGFVTLIGLTLYALARKVHKSTLALLAMALVFLAGMTLISHKEVRYVIPVSIPLVLIASKGFSSFLSRNWKGVLIVLILLLSVFYTLFATPSWIYTLWGDPTTSVAGLYAKENLPEGYVLYSNYDYAALAYYSQKKTIPIMPYEERIYTDLDKFMPHTGWFAYYGHKPEGNMHPNLSFLNSSEHFTFVERVESNNPWAQGFYADFYEYTP